MTMTMAQNERAPAEVEGSTGAALESASGDRHPLHATYDRLASLVNTRAVTYVDVGSGQATTHLLRRSEIAPTRLGGGEEVRSMKVLAHDDDASPTDNIEYAKLVMNCLVVTGTAKTVPMLVARTLVTALQELQLANANLAIYSNEARRLADQYAEAERTIAMRLTSRPVRSVG